MSHEPKGSKPGPIIEREQLSRVNTIPSVEFTIPPSDNPEHIVTKCPSRQTQSGGAQAQQEKDSSANEGEANHRVPNDEEALSIVSDQDVVTYPEGGLQAWLVVLGSFLGTIVAFGMM